MSATANQQDHDYAAHVVQFLHRQEQLLEHLTRAADLTSAGRITVPVGASRRFVELDEWLPGVKRTVAPDRSSGIDSLPLASATPTDVVPAGPGRIGGQIVNSGAVAVILYLATAAGIQTSTAGRAALWLAANGGSWDFRLSDGLWCGPVAAVAQAGASTLAVAVV